MPLATKELRREYARKWVAARRAAFFAGKCCVWCGSTAFLEIDHIDPATKVSNSIWSWRRERREAEIAKCRVLCELCHTKRTAAQKTVPLVHGTNAGYTKRCRCRPCKAAHAAKELARRRAIRGGTPAHREFAAHEAAKAA